MALKVILAPYFDVFHVSFPEG